MCNRKIGERNRVKSAEVGHVRMAGVKACGVVFDFDGTLAIKEAGESDLIDSLPAEHIRDKVAGFCTSASSFCCEDIYVLSAQFTRN